MEEKERKERKKTRLKKEREKEKGGCIYMVNSAKQSGKVRNNKWSQFYFYLNIILK